MQATQPGDIENTHSDVSEFKDSDQVRRVGIDEQFIKFRPSPNFKNMKKFLKSKIDYTETNLSPSNVTGGPSTTQFNVEDRHKVAPVVQPPLPLDPPPPDSPPNINILLKKEIEDVEYQSSPGEEVNEPLNNPEELITNIKTDQSEELGEKEKAKPPICRDFIRGTCKRIGTCKFAHKRDTSQLFGVYTFCRNFQNSVCTLPNCRYVHATVFEEQRFYRTGVLPPNALRHRKVMPPLPPPPPPPPEEPPADIPSSFSNPPPPLHPGAAKPMPIINCIPSATIELRTVEESLRNTLQTNTSPLKREWNEIIEFSNTSRDLETNEQLAKKCKNCEIMEFSIKYTKEEVQRMIRSSEEMNKKMAQLNKKTHKLHTVLLTLLKPTHSNKSSGGLNGLSSSMNINCEKEKTVLEQFNTLMTAGSRLSSFSEDNNKNLLSSGNLSNSTFTSLLAKLLQYSSGDQTITSDVS